MMYSAVDTLVFFFFFFFFFSFFLFSSSIKKICMKCQILLSGKNKEHISKRRLLIILPNVILFNNIPLDMNLLV